MSDYSSKEKTIAALLSNSPKLKDFIKKLYQRFNFIFNKKKYTYKSNYKLIEIDNTDQESFFGYYDKNPESKDGKKVIYYRTSYNTQKEPSKNHCIEIVLKFLDSNKFILIDKTFSYNWQQGAKMMWLNNEEFIYNIYSEKEGKYLSKKYNIESNTFQILDLPIYDCFNNNYALSLNYNRLMDLRPDYGYRNFDEKIDYLNYDSDGVFKLSLKNNDYQILISLTKLIELKKTNTMYNAKHKVNHIMISPDGNNFMFMHRWLSKTGKRYDRLLVSNKEGDSIKIICDEGMVSHCCWEDSKTIIGFFRYKNENGFYKINIDSLTTKPLSDKLKNFGDGHPTYSKNLVLFDSYPNRSRMKNLYIYNTENDEVNFIGEFFESFKFYNQTRCDLHPRFNSNNSSIYIDSVHTGKRKLFKIDLK